MQLRPKLRYLKGPSGSILNNWPKSNGVPFAWSLSARFLVACISACCELGSGGKLDTVIDNVNKVATQVQVLSSKLDDAQGKSDKTIFRTPIVRP